MAESTGFGIPGHTHLSDRPQRAPGVHHQAIIRSGQRGQHPGKWLSWHLWERPHQHRPPPALGHRHMATHVPRSEPSKVLGHLLHEQPGDMLTLLSRHGSKSQNRHEPPLKC